MPASTSSRLVDWMIEDALDALVHARDSDRARDRNECLGGAPLTACTALARLQSLGGPIDPLRLNSLRGRCAEQRLVARLCRQGYPVRNQVRVGPRRGGSVLDVTPFPSGAPGTRRLPQGIENKYIHVPDYRACGAGQRCSLGCLDQLTREVVAHVAQVRRHIQQSAAMSPSLGLPARVRLLYQLGGSLTLAEHRCIGSAIYAAVRRASAQLSQGPQITATVVRADRL